MHSSIEPPWSLLDPLLMTQGKETSPDKDYSRQKMILGTHTSDGEQNYLMIAEVCVCGWVSPAPTPHMRAGPPRP